MENDQDAMEVSIITPNSKEQILLSCPHTFLLNAVQIDQS